MKQFKRSLALMLAFVMLATGLVGCEGKKEDGNTEEKVTQTGEGLYPLDITDSYGNVVTIDEEPMRVVSCAPNLTEMMYDLEAGDKLVGRSDYCDYPSEVMDIASVGAIDNPDLEIIISLEPDLVIATTFAQENIDKLAAADIPVVVLHEEGTLEGVYTMLNDLGQIINRNDEAKTRISEMKTAVSNVQNKVNGLDKPTVYYVISYGEYGDYTAGGDTFAGEILETAGGDNIAKNISGWNITLEEIIEADPYIIIISDYMKDDFINAPNYCELTAVKEGRVYTMDINLIERQGYRNAKGIETLAQIFYPEAFE